MSNPTPTQPLNDARPTVPGGTAPAWQEWLIVILLYVGALAVVGPRAKLSQWQVLPEELQPAGEAMRLLDGHLDLPSRGGDIAEYNGRYYSPFPPLFAIICYAVFGLHRLVIGSPAVFWGWLYVLIVAAPIPALAYRAFRRAGQDAAWSALLSGYLIAGTCLWPVVGMLGNKHGGWIYSTQHLLAQSGLALLLIDLLGKRRIWPGGIGLIIAAWSRQLTLLFGLALLWAAWQRRGVGGDDSDTHRSRRLACAGAALVIALGVPMGLCWAKFGSPLESGYPYVFAGRTDPEAEQARGRVDVNIFGLHYSRPSEGRVHIYRLRYIPYNLYYYHLCPPHFDFDFQGLHIEGIEDGTSLWIGSPLLLLVLWDVRRWWRDGVRRAIMLCSLGVTALLLCHNLTGHVDGGYCRYTLDFTLPWLAVIAPYTSGPRRTWFTLGCLAWSVFYFYMVQ